MQFFTYAKLHSPKPTVSPPSSSPHYPELYKEQVPILTGNSQLHPAKELDQMSHHVPWPSAAQKSQSHWAE